MHDEESPKRLLSTEEAARYLGTSRSALIADTKRADHPKSFRLPGRRTTVYDLEELDTYIARVKADHRGEPLPPKPEDARTAFLRDQIAAWCQSKVMVPVKPGSMEAKVAAVGEALRMKQDVDAIVTMGGVEVARYEYRWHGDKCDVTVTTPPTRPGPKPKWWRAATE